MKDEKNSPRFQRNQDESEGRGEDGNLPTVIPIDTCTIRNPIVRLEEEGVSRRSMIEGARGIDVPTGVGVSSLSR